MRIFQSSIGFRPIGRHLGVSIALLLSIDAIAQQVIAPPPPVDYAPPIRRIQTPPPTTRPSGPPASPFNVGPLVLRPHVQYRHVHANGLLVSPGVQEQSDINTFSPGLLIDAGDHWTIDYTPTWINYSSRAYNDTHDHAVNVQWATTYENWNFNFLESYDTSSPILVETARQTKQRSWNSQLGASYSFSPRLLAQTSAVLAERYGDAFPDIRDWSSTNWLTMRFGTDWNAGLGFALGYTDIVGQPDMTYQRYLGRLNWRFTQKLRLAIEGGSEVRKSRSAAIDDMTNPLLQASLEYQPLPQTLVVISSARTVSNSFFEADVTESADWSVTLEQRLFTHFFLRATYFQQDTDYTGTSGTAALGRKDESESVNVRLTTQIFQRLTIAAFFQNGENSSNLPGFNYSSDQYGIELGYRY